MITREQIQKSTFMPLYKMTTKRMSYQLQPQQQQHSLQLQQQQRRPPDVEEALSSMLWTPYERSSTTDTSSEDEDEQLNRQLKKSKSHYDYTSVPTQIPPLTPPPFPPLLPPPTTTLVHHPAHVVAYLATTTPPVRATSATATSNCCLVASSTSAYYTAEDLCDPSVTTPLVPFSNLMLNANTTNTTTSTAATTATTNSAGITGNEATTTAGGDDDADDSDDEEVIYNDGFNNEPTLAATSSSGMSSYPFKNRLSFTSYGRIPGLTKWWSTSNATTATTTTTQQQSITTEQTPPEISATATATQPPSYESLYKKPLRSLRHQPQQQQQQQPHHHTNKHLNIFKPVLETLKANVTTITQGRFTRCQDNNRVTNTTTSTTTNNRTRTTSPTTLLTNTSNNIIGSSTNTNSNLDNFQHEPCSPTQLVAETNVDNEHIINNNNNNINCSIATITTTPSTQSEPPIRQQQQQTHELTLSHQHQQCELKTTNAQSKQNQEHENKQNNNFIICQQQTPSLEKTNTTTQTEHIDEEYYDERDTESQMNTSRLEMNEYSRDLREYEATTMNCHSSNDMFVNTAATAACASLFYDSSSAISLTRSFEANTSYTVGSTANECFKSGLQQQETRNSTYNLTPNKCLAELERLYAEFRASESLREQLIREKIKETESAKCKSDTNKTENMRLNVPASINSSASSSSANANNAKHATGEKGEAKSMSETKYNPSTSSVFLTTTNSVTTLTNPCQRTPSLTIQVNQNLTNNNNNNNTNGNNNNNNCNESNGTVTVDGGGIDNKPSTNNESRQHVVLNQAIVNTTTNGVSVINCNYVNNNNHLNNNNNNNSNNNNKSITNLCDIATNTNQLIENNQKTNSNINLNPKVSKNINSKSDSDNNFPDIDPHQEVVPKVLTNENRKENPLNALDALNSQRNSENIQVNVIQVNEASSGSTSSTTPLQRTFTSTECQTDDVSSVQLRSPSTSRPLPPIPSSNTNNNGNSRDQRRRDRRERRHLHHTASLLVAPTHAHPRPHPHPHPLRHGLIDRHSMPAPPLPPILHPPHLHPGLQQSAHNIAMLRPMLPDILHNHYPPPYSALPGMAAASGHIPTHNGSPIPFNHPHPHPHHPHHPPPQAPVSLLGPPPPPPQAGTTLLTSVISTVPIPGATPMVSDGRFTLPLPIIRRSPSERSGKGCCGQWFAGPPLRALIAVVALGGVACALGGAALGATGLAGPPSSHFTAALLMIGVGVVLVTVSGAAWRMTAPGGPPCLGLGSSVDLGRCGRRPCSRGGGAPQGLLYPEFQHRPPPPSYQASMQEYRLRLLLLDRDRQNGVVRGSSPPPTYRSHAGSLLRAPLTSTTRGGGGGISGIGLTGGRCESSIGGSEYSFPPSYRSRNPTPGTISSERSIETEPSGRLLANEDIPEPLSVEQLSEYNSLQQRTINANGNLHKHDQRRNSMQMDSNVLIAKTDTNLNSEKKDDLVTIVTITPQTTNDNLVGGDMNNGQNNNNNNNNNNGNDNGGNATREQIEILAHL